jgi:hypothetical protein
MTSTIRCIAKLVRPARHTRAVVAAIGRVASGVSCVPRIDRAAGIACIPDQARIAGATRIAAIAWRAAEWHQACDVGALGA